MWRIVCLCYSYWKGGRALAVNVWQHCRIVHWCHVVPPVSGCARSVGKVRDGSRRSAKNGVPGRNEPISLWSQRSASVRTHSPTDGGVVLNVNKMVDMIERIADSNRSTCTPRYVIRECSDWKDCRYWMTLRILSTLPILNYFFSYLLPPHSF
jgi:hypothetical protein